LVTGLKYDVIKHSCIKGSLLLITVKKKVSLYSVREEWMFIGRGKVGPTVTVSLSATVSQVHSLWRVVENHLVGKPGH
jgi:hypothetical protein